MTSLKAQHARLHVVDSRLKAIAEPPDRPTLKAAPGQRCKDWKRVLRQRHPQEAKSVLQQLVGSIALTMDVGWPATTAGKDAWDTFAAKTGADPDDQSGKEGITLADCSWNAEVNPARLLEGIAPTHCTFLGRW